MDLKVSAGWSLVGGSAVCKCVAYVKIFLSTHVSLFLWPINFNRVQGFVLLKGVIDVVYSD